MAGAGLAALSTTAGRTSPEEDLLPAPTDRTSLEIPQGAALQTAGVTAARRFADFTQGLPSTPGTPALVDTPATKRLRRFSRGMCGGFAQRKEPRQNRRGSINWREVVTPPRRSAGSAARADDGLHWAGQLPASRSTNAECCPGAHCLLGRPTP
jgi:hypothetical protein